MAPTGDTLSDYLGPGLRLISVGLNPSPTSVATGCYFAHPRNRFWPALNGSGLAPRPLAPGRAAMRVLFDEAGFGFTDVVKRPTAGAADLRAADFRRDAPRVRDLLADLRPGLAWFHGKVAFGAFCRYGLGHPPAGHWGLQDVSVAGVPVMVTPNPSPANAAFSLASLIHWFAQVRELIENQPAA